MVNENLCGLFLDNIVMQTSYSILSKYLERNFWIHFSVELSQVVDGAVWLNTALVRNMVVVEGVSR